MPAIISRLGRLPFEFLYGRMCRDQGGEHSLVAGMQRLERKENDKFFLGMAFGYSSLAQLAGFFPILPLLWGSVSEPLGHRIGIGFLTGTAMGPTAWLVTAYLWSLGRFTDHKTHSVLVALLGSADLRRRFYRHWSLVVLACATTMGTLFAVAASP